MLSSEVLPHFVKMYDLIVQLKFLWLETKQTRLKDCDLFLRSIIPNTDNVLFLLFMGGNTTAIMSLQNFLYVFDSQLQEQFIRLSIIAIDMLPLFSKHKKGISEKITETVQLIFVKRKWKFILKILVYLYMKN